MAKIYFATNRNLAAEPLPDPLSPFGLRFNPAGPQFYRVGDAEVTRVGNDPDDGYQVQAVSIAPEAPATPTTPEVLGSSTIFAELQGDMAADQTDAIVLIHGFASEFRTALQRAAQLRDAYTYERVTSQGTRTITPELFVFSWPSDGETVPGWSYANDRQDAEFSGVAMARALHRLIDFLRARAPRDAVTGAIRCNQRIHLVAHSMGNWALRHALLALKQLMQLDRMPRIFDHVFLMAADEDADALGDKSKLGLLPQLGRSIHVYYSSEDGALLISDKSKLNADRLGSIGPKTFTDLPSNIEAIDCVLVDNTDLPLTSLLSRHVNHQYYRLRPEVINDVRNVLSGMRPEDMKTRKVIELGRRYRIDATPALRAAAPARRRRVRTA